MNIWIFGSSTSVLQSAKNVLPDQDLKALSGYLKSTSAHEVDFDWLFTLIGVNSFIKCQWTLLEVQSQVSSLLRFS